MIWAFDAQVEYPSLAATFSRRFFTSALKHELLLRPIGTTVYLMPPYVLSDADTGLLAERLQTVFDEVMHA
jgi:adenosylmethionine-8-amino-7-oxononanoate aminotransferase